MATKITKKELSSLIKEAIKEMNIKVDESDLVAKSKGEWEQAKDYFKKEIIGLIQNIENDNYDDAKNTIGNVISILTMWKDKITKGLEKVEQPFEMGFGGVLEDKKK